MRFASAVRTAVVAGVLTVVLPATLNGQTNLVADGGEYGITGGLPGDQVNPHLAFGTSGGVVAWEDNVTDGDGLGISARRLDTSLSGSLSSFRVNQQGAFDQEHPRVALLPNGSALFVWQSGQQSYQQICGRILGGSSASNVWVTGEFVVNTFSNAHHTSAAIAPLTNGNAVVIWTSYDQLGTGSMQDVFGQLVSPTGQKIGGEFPINQATAYNQRTPAVVTLADGRFLVVWISEQQRFENSVDVYGRLFSANGTAQGGEFLINTGTNICANPVVAASASGGFLVVWGQKDVVNRSASWDIFCRTFDSTTTGGQVVRVNSYTYGDQYGPSVSFAAGRYMVVWTSMAQDGSQEGVFGQVLRTDASFEGSELRVNTTTVSRQLYPFCAADSSGRVLVVWSSFTGGINSFDLFAQRYMPTGQALAAPGMPWVSALNSSELSVTWPDVAGLSVQSYEIYQDSGASPVATITSNIWKQSGLTPASSHTYRIDYTLAGGRKSPLSLPGTGTTWGADNNGDGLPDDWQALYWGPNPANWPPANADSDGDGVSNLAEFLAGTNPTDANDVLQQRLVNTPQGIFLKWNTHAGFMYQVETSTNLNSWTALGGLRLAAGSEDSMLVNLPQATYFRVSRRW